MSVGKSFSFSGGKHEVFPFLILAVGTVEVRSPLPAFSFIVSFPAWVPAPRRSCGPAGLVLELRPRGGGALAPSSHVPQMTPLLAWGGEGGGGGIILAFVSF